MFILRGRGRNLCVAVLLSNQIKDWEDAAIAEFRLIPQPDFKAISFAII